VTGTTLVGERRIQEDREMIRSVIFSMVAVAATANLGFAQTATSRPFTGAKVNGGTVTSKMVDGKQVLTLSSDFKSPDTPDPHWQVVDSKGRVYLLQRLPVKSLGGLATDRITTSIEVPAYVADVAKVQIWCAWAEAVLGEASFAAPQITRR
jgi:hypothetical protein